MTDASQIPDDIRQRLHADMDKIFDLHGEISMLAKEIAVLRAEIARLAAENTVLRKNQRVRARPVNEEDGNASAEA